MKARILTYIVSAIAVAIIVNSCSTTRVIGQREYRLEKNTITITNDKEFKSSELTAYLQQKADGWTPGLCIYNWQNGKGKGWDKFVKKLGVPPVIYDADMVSKSCESLRDHLEWMGYYYSTVTPEVTVKGKKVRVNYNVTLGKRFVIEGIESDIPSEEEFSKTIDNVSKYVNIKQGDYLSTEKLEAQAALLTSAIRDEGYYTFSTSNISFEADTITTPGKAYLKMTISEKARGVESDSYVHLRKFYIDTVAVIIPNSLKFSKKRLDFMNLLNRGDLYSESAIHRTYTRFSSMRTFNSIKVSVKETSDSTLNCDIKLNQAKINGLSFNFEASLNSELLIGLSPQITYYHKNIFGGGEWFKVNFMGNFQFKNVGTSDYVYANEFGFATSLSIPTFVGLPDKIFRGHVIPRTDFTISYKYQDRPEYIRHMISASFGYSGFLDKKQQLNYVLYPINANVVRLYDVDPDFIASIADNPFLMDSYQDHLDVGLQGSLTYTSQKGMYATNTDHFYSWFRTDISGNVLSIFNSVMPTNEKGQHVIWKTPYSQYVRFEGMFTKVWVFGRNDGHSIAARFTGGVGIAYGNSSSLPFEKHFNGGGANSLRGWQSRTVGPGLAHQNTSFSIANQTGDVRLEANLEYRARLIWKLEGAVFLDAGNIWTLEESEPGTQYPSVLTWETFGPGIAMNWGIGLRLNFNVMVVRLDWGMKIHDPATDNKWVNPEMWVKDNGYAVHFAIGYPF